MDVNIKNTSLNIENQITLSEEETPDETVGNPITTNSRNLTPSLQGMGLLFDTHPT